MLRLLRHTHPSYLFLILLLLLVHRVPLIFHLLDLKAQYSSSFPYVIAALILPLVGRRGSASSQLRHQ
jgi:hypothetical protein